jgi:peptide/nickel transport system permease protein
MTNLLIALTVSSIATYARLVRSTVLTLVEQDFIEAARACGSSDLRIIVKHIIPNSLSPIICQMAFSSSGMILTAASMSYLGLGIQPPNPEWGSMLASAKTYMWTYPYLITVPGVCIVLAALSIALIGDGIRDAVDPRLKD